jgi:hypothetical protein
MTSSAKSVGLNSFAHNSGSCEDSEGGEGRTYGNHGAGDGTRTRGFLLQGLLLGEQGLMHSKQCLKIHHGTFRGCSRVEKL